MKNLSSKGEKRDDPIWEGDTVELFLDPECSGKMNGYYHIAINPAGLTMDTGKGDPKWDPKLKAATSKGEKGWTVEVAIPFEEVGVKADGVPAVWGVNLTRYRPEIATEKPRLGTLVPHSWPVDQPDRLRIAEDTGWAKTYADTSHVPTAFGHAIFQASKDKPEGLKPARPPCEIIAKEDFSTGARGKFSVGDVTDGGFMGGKTLHLTKGQVATWEVPLKEFRDVHLLAVMKSSSTGVYWHTFGKMYGNEKCCARQVDTLTLDHVLLTPSFNYCHGAGRIDATSNGVADPYYAGYRKHLLWFSEPTIGHVGYCGPNHFAIVHTRLDQLQTQHPHNKPVDPDKDSIPGWFFHSVGEGEVWISRAVIFRGNDNVPPEKPAGLACKVEGTLAVLSWKEAPDNTLTAWYRVSAGEGKDAQTLAEVADLNARVPLEKVKGRKVTVSAVDYFENFSEPSDAVEAK